VRESGRSSQCHPSRREFLTRRGLNLERYEAMVAPKHGCTSSKGATYDYEGWQDVVATLQNADDP